eukprot:scaffold439601_cov21-Prasinocladus_malaysianus.AAC.2
MNCRPTPYGDKPQFARIVSYFHNSTSKAASRRMILSISIDPSPATLSVLTVQSLTSASEPS